ncbi:MAG: EamA family transporter [Bacillota bacterium]
MSWFAWAIVAAVFWGLGPIFAKMGLEKPDALTALLIRSIAVLVVLVAWGILRGGLAQHLTSVDSRTWFLLLLEGASASVIAHFAYFSALKLGSIANVVPITAAYPLVAVALSVLVLGTKVTAGKWLGAAFTVLGVYFLQRF